MKKLVKSLLASALILTSSSLLANTSQDITYKKIFSNASLQEFGYKPQTGNTCLPTNMYYTMNMLGYEVEFDDLLEFTHYYWYEDALQYYARKYDLNADIVNTPHMFLLDKEELKSLLINDQVLQIRVNSNLWYSTDEYPSSDGHQLSIIGFDEDLFLILDTNSNYLMYYDYYKLAFAYDAPFILAISPDNDFLSLN